MANAGQEASSITLWSWLKLTKLKGNSAKTWTMYKLLPMLVLNNPALYMIENGKGLRKNSLFMC